MGLPPPQQMKQNLKTNGSYFNVLPTLPPSPYCSPPCSSAGSLAALSTARTASRTALANSMQAW